MMSLQIIQDEKEAYRGYIALLSEQLRPAISVHAASEADSTQIQNGIQEMFDAEIARLAYNELRSRGIEEEFLEERNLRSSLEGLPLPDEGRRTLEAQIRQMAMSRMSQISRPEVGSPWMLPSGGASPWLPPSGGGGWPGRPPTPQSPLETVVSYINEPVCICAGSIPGFMQSLAAIDPPPPPPYTITWTIPPDLITCRVESGAAFGILADEMQVGLTTAVIWEKQIHAWSPCRGAIATVYQGGASTTPTFMLLKDNCFGASTILFQKKVFLGWWWGDVGYWEPARFWKLFAGMRLTFRWLAD
jgi:hypothetical protein